MVQAVAEVMKTPPGALLLEVESDRMEGAERELRARRKGFYRTLGAREITGLQWIMPPQGDVLPPPMEMLVMGLAEGSVSREQLRAWLRGIYVEVYGQGAEDERIGSMLANLPQDVPLT
jgi:hypothetical protein